jgi:hypothetical protein
MKFLKPILTGLFMALSVCAFAQFSKLSTLGNSLSANTDDYSRFQIGYVVATPKFDGEDDEDNDKFKGVTLGAIYGTSLNSTIPIFLEGGYNLTWLNWNDSDEDYEEKWNVLNVTVPVNIAYKIGFGNDDFSIVPYAGINFKGNLLSIFKYEDDEESESFSYFDKNDVESGEEWNRFQFGGQIGIGINYKRLYLGYQFQGDFTELAKNFKMPTNSIILGISLK